MRPVRTRRIRLQIEREETKRSHDLRRSAAIGRRDQQVAIDRGSLEPAGIKQRSKRCPLDQDADDARVGQRLSDFRALYVKAPLCRGDALAIAHNGLAGPTPERGRYALHENVPDPPFALQVFGAQHAAAPVPPGVHAPPCTMQLPAASASGAVTDRIKGALAAATAMRPTSWRRDIPFPSLDRRS